MMEWVQTDIHFACVICGAPATVKAKTDGIMIDYYHVNPWPAFCSDACRVMFALGVRRYKWSSTGMEVDEHALKPRGDSGEDPVEPSHR
jgi:hypothetical protein